MPADLLEPRSAPPWGALLYPDGRDGVTHRLALSVHSDRRYQTGLESTLPSPDKINLRRIKRRRRRQQPVGGGGLGKALTQTRHLFCVFDPELILVEDEAKNKPQLRAKVDLIDRWPHSREPRRCARACMTLCVAPSARCILVLMAAFKCMQSRAAL